MSAPVGAILATLATVAIVGVGFATYSGGGGDVVEPVTGQTAAPGPETSGHESIELLPGQTGECVDVAPELLGPIVERKDGPILYGTMRRKLGDTSTHVYYTPDPRDRFSPESSSVYVLCADAPPPASDPASDTEAAIKIIRDIIERCWARSGLSTSDSYAAPENLTYSAVAGNPYNGPMQRYASSPSDFFTVRVTTKALTEGVNFAEWIVNLATGHNIINQASRGRPVWYATKEWAAGTCPAPHLSSNIDAGGYDPFP